AGLGLAQLAAARRAAAADVGAGYEVKGEEGARPSLADLAALSFVASLAFMALEMVAGRLVQRHLGSSIYGWTSVIGVLLGGRSLGNSLGGKVADRVRSEAGASWLFLIASVLTLLVLLTEEPKPQSLADKYLGSDKAILSHAITMTKLTLPGGAEVHL